MIELRNVSKTYVRKGLSIEALKNINIKVDKGDIFGFIGFSGAGKSTLIRLVNRLEKVTSGEVLVEGEQLNTYSTSGLRKVRKKIGMIFQHFNLLESKTVFDNIAIPLVLLKRNKREIEGACERAFGVHRIVGQGGQLSQRAFRRTKATCRDCTGACEQPIHFAL